MTEETSIRERTTEPIIVQVIADGKIVDLTGVSYVEMHMIDFSGKTYNYSSQGISPALAITDPVSGEITFTPPNDDIFKYTRSPYKLYIKVFDTFTESYSVPESGDENIIYVRKEF
jgi:hypothetical protein